jgi:hypothetical protein
MLGLVVAFVFGRTPLGKTLARLTYAAIILAVLVSSAVIILDTFYADIF